MPKVPDPKDAPELTGSLEEALQYIQSNAGQNADFIIRHILVKQINAIMIYYDTVTDVQAVESAIQAIQHHPFREHKHASKKDLAVYLADYVLSSADVLFVNNLWELRESLSRGKAALIIDGVDVAITMGTTSVPHRQVDTPMLESSTRGPQLAFVENVDINVGLIRRALSSDALRVKSFYVGYRSRTKVMLLYEHDVANPNLIETAVKRIQAVHVDKLTGSATLEQRIVDNHWTMFPLTRTTTRVDNCVKEIGQGKALILVDGDPTGILIPGTVVDFFQTMEDDQHSYVEATMIRWLRFISFVLSFYLPALYIACVDFNPELMPQVLSLQIARSREGVPFNAAMEVVIMQMVLEIIREATLRMPKVMGQTLGIVGGLVLGEASVQAGLVSNILIVIISLTAVSVFVLPSYEFATVLRILVWVNILGASIYGFYGIMLVVLALMLHVASLRSFGVDYLTPLSGEHWKDFFLDGITRAPIPVLDRRASHLHVQEETRGADYTDPVQHPLLETPLKRGRGKK